MRVILFTSGTTDAAKGVMLSQRNIMSDIMDTCRIANIRPEDRSLSILPIHHTFESSLGIILMLYCGASVAFCEGLKYIAKNMVEAKITMLIGVPLIFESIYEKIWKNAEKQGKDKLLKNAIKVNRKLKAVGFDLSRKLFKDIHEKFGGSFRLIVTGAAAIDPNVCRGFEDFGFKVVQGYGLTECSPLVAGCPDFANTYKKAGSVGPSVASGEIRIVEKDEDGIGEIIFKGPNVMLGYYNMPEKTAEILKDGWFYTGDLGFLDKEGWLYITGRKKNVIVTKTGKNIYPEEVEFYINRNKYIEESLVHGIEEDNNDDVTVAAQIRPAYDIIYEEFGKDFDDASVYTLIKKLIGDINEKLPIYKRIRNFSVRKEDFEKTTTKKIKRHKNK
jgi:long-chain acyl-CoA synthetase